MAIPTFLPAAASQSAALIELAHALASGEFVCWCGERIESGQDVTVNVWQESDAAWAAEALHDRCVTDADAGLGPAAVQAPQTPEPHPYRDLAASLARARAGAGREVL